MAIMSDQLPQKWAIALIQGWKIVPSSCMCGGRYAWLKPSDYGGSETMHDCVCHNDPDVNPTAASPAEAGATAG